jgi:plasmid stabilization system protein ParE
VKIVFSERAVATLERIGDYIAEENPERALSFVQELRAKALGLAEFPKAFPLVPGHEHRAVRRRVHGAYLILYAVEPEQVQIIAFAHSAQDYGRLLLPDE